MNTFINYVQPTKIKQMKKLTFLLATLLIGGMMFTGCKKDNPQPTPDTPSTPTETTKTVVYTMDNVMKDSNSSATLTVSPYFHYTFKYKDADGTMVSVALGATAVGASATITINALNAESYIGSLDNKLEVNGI